MTTATVLAEVSVCVYLLVQDKKEVCEYWDSPPFTSFDLTVGDSPLCGP